MNQEGRVVTERPGSVAQLEALSDAAAALARAADVDAAVSAILEAATRGTGAVAGAIFLRNPDGDDLYMGANVGLDADAVAQFEADVADPNHPVAAAARDVSAVFGRAAVGAVPVPGIATAADIPLVVARDGLDVALGVVSFAWLGDAALGAADERVLRASADLIAAAVDRAHLAATLAEQTEWHERTAHTDPLTGLANSRTFDRVLELELVRAGRQGGEVSVAIFDVDDFAALNASAGHGAGDEVLRRIAVALAESVRLVDTVARHGPDEFIVVAPGSAGATVARRVLDAVEAGGGSQGRRVTVCAGVAHFPADGASGAELIAAAEGALARAKASGPGALATA